MLKYFPKSTNFNTPCIEFSVRAIKLRTEGAPMEQLKLGENQNGSIESQTFVVRQTDMGR